MVATSGALVSLTAIPSMDTLPSRLFWWASFPGSSFLVDRLTLPKRWSFRYFIGSPLVKTRDECGATGWPPYMPIKGVFSFVAVAASPPRSTPRPNVTSTLAIQLRSFVRVELVAGVRPRRRSNGGVPPPPPMHSSHGTTGTRFAWGAQPSRKRGPPSMADRKD